MLSLGISFSNWHLGRILLEGRAMHGVDIAVVGAVLLLCGLIIWHLIRVYKKSPCGDCASAKQCSSFSKEKIRKAYQKQCKLEEKQNKKSKA